MITFGKTGKRLVISTLLLLYVIGAALLDGYFQYQLTQAMLNGVVIIGLVLLTGISGQVSLGHGAFVAIGAFATAAFMNSGGINAYAAVLLAGAVGFMCGFAFGWPALRLGFVYLTLATFGLAIATPQILKSDHLARWTGGVQGQYLDRPTPPNWFPGSEDYWWFLITVGLVGVVVLTTRNMIESRNGRALIAVRDQPLAAASSGINVKLYKTLTFGISAMFAALAGGLSALLADFVSPDGYTVFLSFMFLVGLVLGGSLSIWGALFGGFFIFFIPVFAGEAYKTMSFPVFGLILLAAILAMPDGISGRTRRLWFKWQQHKANNDTIS